MNLPYLRGGCIRHTSAEASIWAQCATKFNKTDFEIFGVGEWGVAKDTIEYIHIDGDPGNFKRILYSLLRLLYIAKSKTKILGGGLNSVSAFCVILSHNHCTCNTALIIIISSSISIQIVHRVRDRQKRQTNKNAKKYHKNTP